jgi:hypothetical protein
VLVELSVMEQRYEAVLAVIQDGWKVVDVADRLGVSRQADRPFSHDPDGKIVAADPDVGIQWSRLEGGRWSRVCACGPEGWFEPERERRRARPGRPKHGDARRSVRVPDRRARRPSGRPQGQTRSARVLRMVWSAPAAIAAGRCRSSPRRASGDDESATSPAKPPIE